MGIKIDSYIRWSIGEGFGYAKVVQVSDDGVKASLPSGQIVDLESASLEVIEKSEYLESVVSLINKMIKEIGENYMTLEEAQAKITELENAINEKQTLVASELEAKQVLVQQNQALSTELDSVKVQLSEVESKLKEIEKAGIIANRVKELGEAFIKDAFKVENVADANEKIFALSEDNYSLFKNLSVSFTKLTDVKQTNLPASTDQTITTETKLTDETVTSQQDAEALAVAEVENDVDLSSVATEEVNDTFKLAMSSFIKK